MSHLNFQHPQPPAADWHVLVLHDGEEKDIKGIWGPYAGDEQARRALTELGNWPIDGQWSVFALKRFPVATGGVTHRSAVTMDAVPSYWDDPQARG